MLAASVCLWCVQFIEAAQEDGRPVGELATSMRNLVGFVTQFAPAPE